MFFVSFCNGFLMTGSCDDGYIRVQCMNSFCNGPSDQTKSDKSYFLKQIMFPRKLFLYILKVLYIISTFYEKVNTLKYKSKQVLNTREMALDKNQLRKWKMDTFLRICTNCEYCVNNRKEIAKNVQNTYIIYKQSNDNIIIVSKYE